MVPVFYGFDFGAYRYWGPTYSILFAILFFSVQLAFSFFWFEHFCFGPFEWIWRVGTLRTWNVPLRKNYTTKGESATMLYPNGFRRRNKSAISWDCKIAYREEQLHRSLAIVTRHGAFLRYPYVRFSCFAFEAQST